MSKDVNEVEMTTNETEKTFCLLMVEDDPVARTVILRMVERRFPNCVVHEAENGKEGLRLFEEHRPDIVVTDINMPEMDGVAMARAIRELDAGATFIVLTAYGNQRFVDELSAVGYCAYLLKPVNFKELFATIEKCFSELREGSNCR